MSNWNLSLEDSRDEPRPDGEDALSEHIQDIYDMMTTGEPTDASELRNIDHYDLDAGMRQFFISDDPEPSMHVLNSVPTQAELEESDPEGDAYRPHFEYDQMWRLDEEDLIRAGDSDTDPDFDQELADRVMDDAAQQRSRAVIAETETNIRQHRRDDHWRAWFGRFNNSELWAVWDNHWLSYQYGGDGIVVADREDLDILQSEWLEYLFAEMCRRGL